MKNERQARTAADSSTEAELLPSASLAQNTMLWAVFVRTRNVLYFTLLPYLVGKLSYEFGLVNPEITDFFIQHIASGYLLIFVLINILIAIPFVVLSLVSTILYYLITGEYLLENEKLNDKFEKYIKMFSMGLVRHFRGS